MPPYDGDLFSPPAPVARVTLRDPRSGAVADNVPMLLDSGADVTLVPRGCVDQLGAAIDTTEGFELTAFDGSTSVAQAVALSLVLLGKTFRGKFLVVDQEWGLIGRDILNHILLVLDGPRMIWREARGEEVAGATGKGVTK